MVFPDLEGLRKTQSHVERVKEGGPATRECIIPEDGNSRYGETLILEIVHGRSDALTSRKNILNEEDRTIVGGKGLYHSVSTMSFRGAANITHWEL